LLSHQGLNGVKKVLIADNDSVTCGMLKRVLKDFSGELEIVTAENGKEASGIISKDDISLVITELDMPVMDGFELLSHIRFNHSHIPVFVMTAFGTPEIKARIDAIGYAGYFEKPLNIEFLTKRTFEEIDSEIEGKINGISIPSYLQIVEKERKTCTLLLTSGEKKGKLFFLNGELVSAETGILKNEDAAYEIVGWNGTDVSIKNGCQNKKGTIKQSLKNILMEGLKNREKNTDKKKKPKQKPLGKSVSASTRLKNILKSTGGIIEYVIFNDKGSLIARHSRSGDILKCRASAYLKFAEHLNDLVNGGILRYIVLTMENNLRYIMFKYKNSRIAIAVEPGFKADDFLKRILA